ncbi:phospholipase A [Desulfoplanes formicivorans]|uniref:Phosphatidylcholine 1-acylhydrolase n=1 Tax=Desulfoplanes formicivorans TaxID=1592317 RepID=A0A194AGT6_9BACT|nr:phospholipase A [Desulfoplanes formicivorans]GAU08296.1 phospholipase [Desulfoplanes formicivorans]
MKHVPRLLVGLMAAVLMSQWLPLPVLWAGEPQSLEQCACIKDDTLRLQCYDRLASSTGAEQMPERSKPPVGEEEDGAPAVRISPEDDEPSYLTRHWELDESGPRGRFAFMPHRDNYILPFTYNKSPNHDHTGEVDTVKNAEVAFQLSMKVKLWQDVLGQNMDLWFGYTQRSFWQLYNVDESAPFRETNYEPEVLLNYRTDWNVLGVHLRTVTVGLNHQSNGRAESLSRSWNRVVGNLGLEYDDFVVQLKTWYRIPESQGEDDNPDIDEYMGPGELWVHYLLGGHRLGAMWRNNCRWDHNRGALQLEWAFPLGRKLNGYIQYFTGYGESLIDYDHAVDRIGIGFILNDWD